MAAIVGVDAEGTICWWSEDAAVWFGHAVDDVVGRPVDVLVPEEHRGRHWEGFQRVMAGGERHLEGASINLPVLLADGRVLAFPARFNHLFDARGSVVGAVGVFSARTGTEEPWTLVD